MRSIKTTVTPRDLIAPAIIGIAAAAMAMTTNAHAQTPYGQTQQPNLGSVVGALFGINSNLDPQWLANRRPLETGRAQFESQLTADVRAGTRSSSSADRLRTDYDALVQLETRYGSDGRFTTQERADLNAQYQAFTQRLNVVDNTGNGYPNTGGGYSSNTSVADGRADFETRINSAVTARRITRTQATSLRTDYQALIQTEAGYARNGIDAREQADLDAKLDALDARLGDGPSNGGYQPVLDNRTRLANIDAAVSAGERSGSISRTEAADIRVEYGDLTRLEAAYSRTSPSADDRDYLLRRIGELETRARVSTRR
ncbi:hypothetical protein [Brevundimonas goettingensis]|uniref:Uncharacterized protein n=1 Tax=Brevundimonas goettingensis TaxID=2774190 RepID=A0A975GV70_9CAUL|nr:hypothetical protein [Brevundimonas goettingensis]QTC90219.1 hypothetical protein IFJ75_13120 [Brevundimonas goettingensis]